MVSAAMLFASVATLSFGATPRLPQDTTVIATASDSASDSVVRSPRMRWSFAVDTPQVRPRSVEYSDWYARRLTIHRIGSYTMLPLFAAEYLLGDRLLNGTNVAGWVKPAHTTVAAGLGVLFTVNTITGAWNLWDSRHDTDGRTRKWLHTGLMLASDAGFLWTAALAGDADEGRSNGQMHRNVAIGSIALSTVGTALMWFWKE